MAEVLEAATIVVSGKAPSLAETTAPRLPSILIHSPKHNEKRSVSGQLAVGLCHTRAYRGIRYTKFVTVTRKERLMQQKILAAMREWLQLGMANRFYNHLIS
jgi:hypothetical protein